MKTTTIILTSLIILFSLSNCSKDGDLNLFSVAQDIEFGEMMDSVVNADFQVLARDEEPEAYAYLESMLNEILSSDEILYRDKFVWKVTIINDDVLNAFATPGGYLYFYTGMIKYLDNGAHLAGVMAHEVAHSDRRHSTETMTKMYGFSLLASLLLGKNENKLVEIATDLALGLGELQYSRNHETEADEYAVRYTMSTKFHPRGVAGFFEKLIADGQTPQTFEFLSTHPNPDNRVEEINQIWTSLQSPTGTDDLVEYTRIKGLLP